MRGKLAGQASRIWQVAVASSLSVLVQFVAIVTLSPKDYGLFALFYLFLGLGNAAVYSLICEPWATEAATERDWPEYSAALVTVGIVMMTALFGAGVFVSHAGLAAIYGGAVAVSLFRVGARYYSVFFRRFAFVARADTAASVTFLAAWAVLRAMANPLVALGAAWMLASLAAAVLSERAVWPRSPAALIGWTSARWVRAKYMLADSGLQEAGSLGVPLALTPAMGLADFGIYRAVSSAAIPVRLLINPLRPSIARASLSTRLSTRAIMGVGVLAAALASAVYGVLVAVEAYKLADGSTLSALSGFRIPVALFVLAATVETCCYLSLRVKFADSRLVIYKAVQLALFVALPVGGFLLAGLEGAIWGYFGVTACMAIIACGALARGVATSKS